MERPLHEYSIELKWSYDGKRVCDLFISFFKIH